MNNAVTCPYCNQAACLVGGDAIYPHRPDLFSLKFWRCAPCDAYVGTHKNYDDHRPLGRLANAELRGWKQRVHQAFDPLWQDGQMSRSKAYSWAAEALGLPKNLTHIGMFDVETCKRLIAAAQAVSS